MLKGAQEMLKHNRLSYMLMEFSPFNLRDLSEMQVSPACSITCSLTTPFSCAPARPELGCCWFRIFQGWEVLELLDDAGFDLFLIDIMHPSYHLSKHWDPEQSRTLFPHDDSTKALLGFLNLPDGVHDDELVAAMRLKPPHFKAFTEIIERGTTSRQANIMAVHRSRTDSHRR